jgi:broad specificity phosphatase PhoE
MYPDIYLFRHGITFAVKEKHSSYGADIYSAEILPEGIPAIEKMAGFLKDIPSEANFCSEFLRCRQTTEIVTKITGKQFNIDSRIGEIIHGEDFGLFSGRIKSFLDGIKEYKGKGNIMICTHGAVMAGIVNWVSTGKFPEENKYIFPPPGVVLHVKDGLSEEVFRAD